MFARKHVHIAGSKAAVQIATAAGQGVAMGLVGAYVYKVLYCDSDKTKIDAFYKSYVPPTDADSE